MDYYAAKLPRPLHDGNSKFVSQDVYDAVESMKAALLETFSTGNKTLRLLPGIWRPGEHGAKVTGIPQPILTRSNTWRNALTS